MYEEIFSTVLKEIEKFKYWANYEEIKCAEWETEYLDWDIVYKCTRGLFAVPYEDWNEEIIESILYILARDNECEIIIDMLIESQDHLVPLAQSALTFPDYDARWQVCYGLGELTTCTSQHLNLLYTYTNDRDEYVRRKSLWIISTLTWSLTEE